tara:strand:+ start:420 stop:593 length:174 start_codon:yes stop_codon:yes gene_type:complete
MNINTKQIMSLLNISQKNAECVQDEMAINGVDFSECTQAEFAKEAKMAWEEINEGGE